MLVPRIIQLYKRKIFLSPEDRRKNLSCSWPHRSDGPRPSRPGKNYLSATVSCIVGKVDGPPVIKEYSPSAVFHAFSSRKTVKHCQRRIFLSQGSSNNTYTRIGLNFIQTCAQSAEGASKHMFFIVDSTSQHLYKKNYFCCVVFSLFPVCSYLNHSNYVDDCLIH